MQVFKHAVAVIATSTVYCLIYQLNEYAFAHLHYAQGAMWIFLPSGVRLAAVLILGGWGALGIGLGAFVMALLAEPAGDLGSVAGTALISGVSPLVALWICQNKFKLDVELTDFSASMLLKMTVIFAVVSPLLHQGWNFLQGYTEHLLSSLLVMSTGDLIGTIIMFYVAKLFLSQLPRGLLTK